MLEQMTTTADLSDIGDMIQTASAGDGDRLLDICEKLVEVLRDVNRRLGKIEDLLHEQ